MDPNSPSLTEIDLREAMKKQNDNALFLTGKVIDTTKAKSSNFVFSPASINSAIIMFSAGPEGDIDAGGILSYMRSSSVEELKAVFSEISSVVFANNSSSDGPKISNTHLSSFSW
ncbi:unnamed protein product [Arabis nemorensis]|uniref:Serpin domain-containing protein n=1 Tax=Arabis nemorensis TaxID=586526 RepID=A0A565BE39_9BRAS|nr:unnamed protein product [Arabis nemorensis]